VNRAEQEAQTATLTEYLLALTPDQFGSLVATMVGWVDVLDQSTAPGPESLTDAIDTLATLP
jgi:hypothetical protein